MGCRVHDTFFALMLLLLLLAISKYQAISSYRYPKSRGEQIEFPFVLHREGGDGKHQKWKERIDYVMYIL